MGNQPLGAEKDKGELCFGCKKRHEKIGVCRVCQKVYCIQCVPTIEQITCGNCNWFVQDCPNFACQSSDMKMVHAVLNKQFQLQSVTRPVPTDKYNEVKLETAVRCGNCIDKYSTQVACGHLINNKTHATKCLGCERIECVICFHTYRVKCETCNVAPTIWWCKACRTIPGTFTFTDWIITVSKQDEKNPSNLPYTEFKCRHCMDSNCGFCKKIITRSDKLTCTDCKIRLCSTCYLQPNGYCRTCQLQHFSLCDCGQWNSGHEGYDGCGICGAKIHTNIFSSTILEHHCRHSSMNHVNCCAHATKEFRRQMVGFICDGCGQMQPCKHWDHRYNCYYCGYYDSCEPCLLKSAHWKMGTRYQFGCPPCTDRISVIIRVFILQKDIVPTIFSYLWYPPQLAGCLVPPLPLFSPSIPATPLSTITRCLDESYLGLAQLQHCLDT